MAPKTSWHRYGTKLRHSHPVYRRLETKRTVGLPIYRHRDVISSALRSSGALGSGARRMEVGVASGRSDVDPTSTAASQCPF